MYEDKAAYEAAGWVCNILAKPTVNEEEAFTSAYAVIKQEGIDPARVMEIIYAFHTDAKLHNLLRFGIENINYILDENTVKELCEETPLGRIGTPKDVANLAYFLASDEASFITGQIIGVDGGFAV